MKHHNALIIFSIASLLAPGYLTVVIEDRRLRIHDNYLCQIWLNLFFPSLILNLFSSLRSFLLLLADLMALNRDRFLSDREILLRMRMKTFHKIVHQVSISHFSLLLFLLLFTLFIFKLRTLN